MIKKNELEKIIYYILNVLLIGLPGVKLLSYTLAMNGIVENSFVINHVYLLWVVIPPLLIIYLIGLLTRKFKFTYTDYIMYFLIIFAFISTVFARNQNIAIFGEEYRNEGFLSIISYYFIFLNAKNIDDKRYKNNLIKIFIGVALFQTIYGILQVYTHFPFIKHFSKAYMSMGLCGNPNFFGSYIIMPLMISISYYLIDKKNKFLILSILFFIGLVTAGSSGPFIGFILAFVFLLICFHKKTNLKTNLKLIIILIITFFMTDYSTKYMYNNVFKENIDRGYNISTELVDTIIKNEKTELNIGNGRLQVWKKSLPLVKKYWVIGAGLDNFGEVYPNTGRVRFDKAHNAYLQVAITNGCIVLALYCLLCLIIFIKGMKFKNKYHIGIYMAFVAYSIQAFANISVIDVAPIFFMILGLLHSKDNAYLEENI